MLRTARVAATPQYAEYELDRGGSPRRGARMALILDMQPVGPHAPLPFALEDPVSLGTGDYDLVVRGHSARITRKSLRDSG